jgi:putative endonuclease
MKLRPNKDPFRFTLGERGEAAAWGFLLKKGFKILERNYRCPLGEIDVVARKDGRIVFVEIKTRSSRRFGAPEESVHAAKQKKMVRLAEWYRKEKGAGKLSASFAVVAIDWRNREAPHIRLIEDAFSVDGAVFEK